MIRDGFPVDYTLPVVNKNFSDFDKALSFFGDRVTKMYYDNGTPDTIQQVKDAKRRPNNFILAYNFGGHRIVIRMVWND